VIIYTGGTFDLFHKGHVNLLKWCKNIGDKVVVSLNTDEFISSYKGKPPVVSFDERKEVLLSCKYVDEVIPNYAGADSKPAILSVMPNVIVIGSDWAKKDYCLQMGFDQDWLDSHGIGMCYVPYTADISTTKIKERM